MQLDRSHRVPDGLLCCWTNVGDGPSNWTVRIAFAIGPFYCWTDLGTVHPLDRSHRVRGWFCCWTE
jgi:hypothetical protein